MSRWNLSKDPFQFEGSDTRAIATLNNEIVEFRVSSQALSFASPVWKKFVDPMHVSSGRMDKDTETPEDKQKKRKRNTTANFDADAMLDFKAHRIDAGYNLVSSLGPKSNEEYEVLGCFPYTVNLQISHLLPPSCVYKKAGCY